MSARADQHRQHWLAHRRALEELVTRLPDSAAAFRPWDGAMTTAALVAHTAQATNRLLGRVEGGDAAPAPSQPPTTMAEVREALAAATAETSALLERLTDAQIDRTVALRPGTERPGAAILAMALDHEIHHKGQLWVYARMCGVEPPAFAARPR